MVRLMDEDNKQGKTESLAEMIEREAIENAHAQRKALNLPATQPCPDCERLRGLIKSATKTLGAQQELINGKDAEIAELKERIETIRPFINDHNLKYPLAEVKL